MHKTFTLQNMQTYFSNYVGCPQHPHEPITNFCTDLLKFMCPECVEIHSKQHVNHKIQSIRTCIKRSSDKLQHTIQMLESEANSNVWLKYKSLADYQKDMFKELEQVRKSLVNQINAHFSQKQQDIHQHISQFQFTKQKFQSLQQEMMKAITELKQLKNNLTVNHETIMAIKKVNKIDYHSLVSHFQRGIRDAEREMHGSSINISLDPNMKKQFQKILNGIVCFKANRWEGGNDLNKNMTGSKMMNKKRKVDNFKMITEESGMQNDRVDYITNPPPLSADRLLNQAAFRINQDNYFECEPFLHFFQLSKSNLHLLKLKDLRQNQSPQWLIIPLEIDFLIPSFHRTLATPGGSIYIVGGTILETMDKSRSIYKFEEKRKTLSVVGELNIGRSSHSVVYHQRKLYIVGGLQTSQYIPKKCEQFNLKTGETRFISPCKHATMNSTLCTLNDDFLVKLGGVDPEGHNSDFVQLYSIQADFWTEVDPTIEQIKGQFGLLSCSGWAPLNEEQIFIFGGFNEEQQNQSSKMSFVLQYDKEDKQFYIKYINMKNLPLAQGFWNPQGIIHDGLIYALQNVDGEEDNDCLEDKRNILIFNGKYWSTCFYS